MPQVVIVSSLGPQGPVGPQGLQGLTGSMAESNSGSFAITGSLTVSGSSTFTNIGPAIFSGSSNFTSLTASSALISGDVTVLGTASINTLIVNQTQLSTGSNQLGDAANDTQTLYGTVRIPTGSFTVSGSSYFTGNVGIGTANPSFILDVVGNTRTNLTSFASQFKGDGGYANANAFSFSGNGNIGMYFPSNVNLGFSTSGSERMRIDASGSVGIGVTTPNGRLHVYENGLTSYKTYTTTDAGVIINSYQSQGNPYTKTTDIVAASDGAVPSEIRFFTRTSGSATISERLRINSSGSVGIGTISPGARLEIDGNSYTTGLRLSNTTSHSTNLFQSNTVFNINSQFVGDSISIQPADYLSISTYSGSIVERLRVINNGNVGIGTTTPSYKLDIAGDTQIQSSYFLRFANEWGIQQTGTDLNIAEIGSADGRLYLKAGGNVGIGTTAPGAKLDVLGTGVFGSMTASRGNYSNGLSLQNSAGQATSLFLWQAGIGSGHFGFPSGSSNLYIVNSYNTGLITEPNYIVLSNTGNVGIGTTAPTARLHVVGTGSTSATAAFLVRNSNLSASMVIKDDGFVGIGTTSPTGKVHITPYPSYYTLVVGRSNGYSSIKASTDDALSTTLALDSAGGATILNHYVSDNVWLVTGGGNAGVGTNAPTARLHAKGTGTTSATTAFRVENSNTSASMVVLDNGYMGIGTAAPSYSLDVYGSYHQYQVQGQLARYDISSANANQNRGVWDFYTNVAVAPDFFGRFGFKFEGGVSDSFKQYQVHIGDSTTPKFIVDGAGRVAIGTITPSASLHISGSSGSVLLEVDSNSSSNILFVSGSGNVGIGTNTPVSKLTVVSGTDTIYNDGTLKVVGDIALNSANNLNPGLNRWALRARASGSEGAFDIYDARNSVSRLFISGSGNIGIGTTNPSTLLHTLGTTPVRAETTSGNTKAGFEMASAYYGGVGAGTYFYPGGPSIGNNIFGEVANNLMQTNLFQMAAGTMKIGVVGSGDTQLYTNSLPRLTISSSGNVGIGTTSPVSKLQVTGNGATYGEAITWTGATDYGGANRGFVGYDAAGATTAYIGNEFIGGDAVSARFQIRMGTSPKLTVMSGGNIGIGTTTPSASLHISGSSGSVLLEVDSNLQQNILYVSGSGNIGVGTSTPGFKLDVNGSISGTSLNSNFAVVSTRASKADFYGFTGPTLSYYNGVSVVPALTVNSTGNITINTTTDSGAKLAVRGAGSTSATTAFRVENANASSSFTITDDLTSRFFGNVGIGALPASGSLHISGAASTSSAAVYIYKSGSTTLDIQGSQGQLFSVTDTLSGSLMSVNDISGLPILEVFSDDRVIMGSFSQPALLVTGSAVRFPATASATPTYTGSEGQVVFGVVGGNAFIYAWLGGRWRSGSLA